MATAGIAMLLLDLKGPSFPLPQLAPALEVMQNETKISLTNSGLAKLVGISVSAFERQIRLHLHTSPMQFHRKLRLARAAAALIQSQNSIAEIAQRFGFSDQGKRLISIGKPPEGFTARMPFSDTGGMAGFDDLWQTLPPKEQVRLGRLLTKRVSFDGPGGNVGITFHQTGLKSLTETQLEHAQRTTA